MTRPTTERPTSARHLEDFAYVSNHEVRDEAQPLGDILKHVAMHPGDAKANKEFQLQQLARGGDGDRGDWRSLPNVSWVDGALGTNNDATTESYDGTRASKYMSRPTKLHFKLVIMMFRYCMYTVREGITLTFTSTDDFDGVLELLFFTDSDHVGNADGSSNSGTVAFLNGNCFHGYSCGQKSLTTQRRANISQWSSVCSLRFGRCFSCES